ncbi:unnamed protein product [Auanema sp. JU1783]|nr:unnamed protein product [Auanema sp. JU1783]
MYSYLSSCFFQCCPQGSFLIPIRRGYPHYSDDDEFEKYERRPKIIVDDPEVSSLHSYITNNHVLDRTPSDIQLQILAQYSLQKKTVIVKILKLLFNGLEDDEQCCVRLSLSCAKVPKQQTSQVSGSSLEFGETFFFSQVEESDIANVSIRFRLYTKKHKSRSSLKAETQLECSHLSTAGTIPYALTMNRIMAIKSESASGLSPSMHRVSNGNINGDSRRNSMVDACGRFCSQPNNDAPELLISLSYDAEHSCVTVGIERGSQFGEKYKPPDTFIKIVASGEFGNEFSRQKTELVKGSSEPHYDHSSSIQLHRPDLETTTVRIEVWQQVGVLRRRVQMGWLAVGLNSSTPDAQEHWEQMIQGQGISVSKWHPLQPPE